MANDVERNDRDIWRMVEGNPSIAFEDEIIAYDVLAWLKARDAESPPSVVYDGPVDDLLDGPGAFADGLTAAYHAARRVVDQGNATADDVLAALAKLAGV